jgi:hypothetical protein
MKNKHARTLLWIALAALLCGSGAWTAAAQGQIDLEKLEIVLWPEFDSPEMLVIYRITLPETTELPVWVSVPIPREVEEPHAVAIADAAGETFLTPYTIQESGEWSIVTLEASTTEVRVEYYAALEIDGDRRAFAFEWPGGYEVGEFGYEFQQPVGADEPTIDPAPDESGLGLYGLTYYAASLGALTADATAHIEVSYARDQSKLSADLIQQVPPLSRPDATTGETPEIGEVLRLFGALLLGVLLAVGGFMLVRVLQARKEGPGQRPKQRTRRRTVAKDHLDTATVFCHACGRQAGASDRYCRSCGSQLRR